MNTAKCKWCNSCERLYQGYCEECYTAYGSFLLGYTGTWAEFDSLVKDTDSIGCLAWVLSDTLYLFGNTSIATQ